MQMMFGLMVNFGEKIHQAHQASTDATSIGIRYTDYCVLQVVIQREDCWNDRERQ
jgi:hypothetical protein